MELRSTKNRQNYLISFQYFLYYNKLYKPSISKQRYSQLAGSITENVAKLSFASERMQAAERAHNFVVDFCLQTTSPVVEVLQCRSPFRSLPSRLIHRTLTQMRCRTVAIHRRWYRSLWESTTLAVEIPKDLLVASHWLERSSCRFDSQSSRSQYFTSSNHLLCGFISTFYWRLASKASKLIRPPADWSTAVTSYASVNSDARSIQISSQNIQIFEYAAKQACKQLQCNKAKLSEPASINELHIHRA